MGSSKFFSRVILIAAIAAPLTALNTRAAFAQASPQPVAQKVKVTLNVGLGWQICDDRSQKTPVLESAFECQGLQALPTSVELELTKKPARQPDWDYYDATYTATTGFGGAKTTLELLVAYADLAGQKMAYVDGRMTTTFNGKKTEPIYFQLSGEGGFDKISYTSTYGSRIPMTVGGLASEYLPYVAFNNKPLEFSAKMIRSAR
jgi:hypothetical protein